MRHAAAYGCAADKTVLGTIKIKIRMKVIHAYVRTAGGHKRIEIFAVEKQRRTRAGLVAIVFADQTLLRVRVVRLTDAR